MWGGDLNMDTFLVIQRGKEDWVVIHCADVDENGQLKEGAKPLSQNHRLQNEAAGEKEKVEEKFGLDHANSAN